MALQGFVQRECGARQQLGVLVEQQRIASARAPQELRVVESLAAPLGERDHGAGGLSCGTVRERRMLARRLGGAVARAVVEHQHLGSER